MKPKKMGDTSGLAVKTQSKTNKVEEQPNKAWRMIVARLAAVFMIIVFLASECAALLPVN